jgi:hypothetical protein
VLFRLPIARSMSDQSFYPQLSLFAPGLRYARCVLTVPPVEELAEQIVCTYP